jgi:hypothetical protein
MTSGMRVNYHKGEIVPINLEHEEEVRTFACVFWCPVGSFPITYLGIPLHHNKLKVLSHVGKLILIRTCLASIPVCLLSFFKFPRWAFGLINSHMGNYFWDDYQGHRKLHLAN